MVYLARSLFVGPTVGITAQGIGYTVKPLAVHRDNNGSLWATFAATKGNDRLHVYEPDT
jgi:hypothetical protein